VTVTTIKKSQVHTVYPNIRAVQPCISRVSMACILYW